MMGDVIPFVPPPLAPRDPRFLPRPVEMVQLASDWRGTIPPTGWEAEEKHDGIRCLWVDGVLYTREGVPLDIPHVAGELARLQRRFGEPMALDGEYVEPGGFLATLAWLQSKGRREAAGLFHLFDAVPAAEWRADACELPLTARRRLIRTAMGDWTPQHVVPCPARPVASADEVQRVAAEVWRAGGEGLMLKRGDGLYRRARSADWLKVKRALDLVGRVAAIGAEGRSLSVEIGGRMVRVSAPVVLGRTLSVGMQVRVTAMEWTDRGQLRQGRAVAIAA